MSRSDGRRSLLLERVHTMRRDGTPRCGWDNVPDPAFPQMQAELPYCGVCVLIDLHQERFDPAHDPAPWTTALPQPCQPPDLMPWEALALLDRARWHLTLADLSPWVRDDHHWWFQMSEPDDQDT